MATQTIQNIVESKALASRQSDLRAYILAARPKTLTAAAIPVLVGAAVAMLHGANSLETTDLHWWLVGVVLVSALAIQIGTNFFNDAIDFKKGADTTDRLGPVRVTAQGLLSPSQVFRAAYLSFGIALVSGAVLVWAGGLPILVIGIASLLFGYCYTGGPYPLAYHGLGDLFVLIFFGVIAVLGTAFLLVGAVPVNGLIAGIQVGLPAVVLIAINNLRDIQGDRAVGKKTLAVMLGRSGARVEIAVAAVSPFILGLWWWEATIVRFLPLLALPLAIGVVLKVYRTEPSREYNVILMRAALLHLMFGFLLACALVVSALTSNSLMSVT